MILSEAISFMKVQFGFRTDLDTEIISMLGVAQEHFEKGPNYPWFLLSEESLVVTSPGERRIPLPDDFIAEYEEGALYYAPTDLDYIEMTKEDNDYLTAFYGSRTEGEPEAYSQDGLYFRVYPLPDALYTLKALYYKKDVKVSSLSTTSTNLWLTHASDTIIGWAGVKLAVGLRDNVAKEAFMMLERQGRALMENQTEQKKHVNRSYQIGGPEA